MSVGFEVRRSDFIWMYLGSWGLPIALAPGLLLIVIGLSGIVPMFLGLPRDPTIPFANYLFLGAVGLAALVAGPAYLCFLLAKGNGIDRVVGRTVSLRIDDAGVWDGLSPKRLTPAGSTFGGLEASAASSRCRSANSQPVKVGFRSPREP